MTSQYLTPDQTAERYGLTVAYLAQLRYRGSGPGYLKPSPRIVRYRPEDVEAWLDASAITSARTA